jgi:hypothetical protein
MPKPDKVAKEFRSPQLNKTFHAHPYENRNQQNYVQPQKYINPYIFKQPLTNIFCQVSSKVPNIFKP